MESASADKESDVYQGKTVWEIHKAEGGTWNVLIGKLENIKHEIKKLNINRNE